MGLCNLCSSYKAGDYCYIALKREKEKLYQSYPKSILISECWIPYEIDSEGLKNVKIKICNILGQTVKQINLDNKSKGKYLIKGKAAYWDGK